MPRGQAIPDVRGALFGAVDRILADHGPDGIASRAITDEAGVAKGVLHHHFGDLAEFLAAYAVERVTATFARAASFLRVGSGEVVENITDAAVDLFGSGALAVSALLTARPTVFARVRQLLDDSGAGLDRLERSFADYLDAERAAGRLPGDADCRMLAFHLVASIHHLFYVTGQQPLQRPAARRIAASLLRH